MLKRLGCVFFVGDTGAAVRDIIVMVCMCCARVADRTSLGRAEMRCDPAPTLNVTISVQRARGQILNLSVTNWSFGAWLGRATDGITLSSR